MLKDGEELIWDLTTHFTQLKESSIGGILDRCFRPTNLNNSVRNYMSRKALWKLPVASVING